MQIDNQKLIKRARELVFLIALRKQSFVKSICHHCCEIAKNQNARNNQNENVIIKASRARLTSVILDCGFIRAGGGR